MCCGMPHGSHGHHFNSLKRHVDFQLSVMIISIDKQMKVIIVRIGTSNPCGLGSNGFSK